MRSWTGWLAAAALLTTAACSGISTSAQVTPGANLNAYHTFAFNPTTGGAISPGEQEARAALERNLAAKGIVPATTAPPDFLVALHARTQEKVESYGYGYGYWGYPGYDTYTEGTLIVDFIDPRTHQVFWRGTASATLDHPDNPDPGKIDDAVAKLVKQYPGTMASAPQQTM